MKTQKFYPRQVLRRLHGDHRDLDKGQLAAIRYATLNGRKLGIRVWVHAAVDTTPLMQTGAQGLAEAVMANASTRIELKELPRLA